MVHQEIFLEKTVNRRRLGAGAAQTGTLHNGHLRRPIRTPADTVDGEPVLVYFRSGLRIIDHAREHTLGVLVHLDGRLSGSRSVYREKANPERQDGREAFGEIFLAAVEAVNSDHQRHRALGILGQAQVADDLFPFKWNVDDLQRGIPEAGMREKGFDGFLVGALLPGRGRNWPAAERVKAPGTNVIRIRLGWISLLQTLGLGHVLVGAAHRGSG